MEEVKDEEERRSVTVQTELLTRNRTTPAGSLKVLTMTGKQTCVCEDTVMMQQGPLIAPGN